MKVHSFLSLRNEAVGLGILLLVWSAAALFYPSYVLPSPWETFGSLRAALPPETGRHLLLTLWRVLAGLGLGLAAGMGLGALACALDWEGPFHSLMTGIQVLPGTVLGVILLLVCGAGSWMPILLVALLTLPTLAINTFHALKGRDRQMEEYLQTLHGRKIDALRWVYFPALVPALQSNLSLGVGLAVKVVVLGEFIGVQDGLGFLLNRARLFLDMKAVFVYLSILLLFSLVFQAARSLFFSTCMRKYFFPA